MRQIIMILAALIFGGCAVDAANAVTVEDLMLDHAKADTKSCVQTVRAKFQYSDFDAYVTYDRGNKEWPIQFHHFASQRDLFAFNKCMTEKGWNLQP